MSHQQEGFKHKAMSSGPAGVALAQRGRMASINSGGQLRGIPRV